jgi:hypothetical protein
MHFGIADEAPRQLRIDATVDLLTNPAKRSELAVHGAARARQFARRRIAARWHDILRGERTVSDLDLGFFPIGGLEPLGAGP